MQITYAEDHIGRGGTFAGYLDDEETRSWRIQTDSRLVTKKDIEQFGWSIGTLPRPFLDRYPGYGYLLCKSLEIRQQDDKGGMVWRATARYDSKPFTQEQKEQQTERNPLLRAAVYSTDFERSTRPVRLDQDKVDPHPDGKPVVNSAGDVFVDPVTRPLTRLRLKGRKNVPVDNVPTWILDLKDKINGAAITIFGLTFPEKTLLFIPGTISEPEEENEIPYRVMHWELEYREETWKEKRVDNGYNQLDIHGVKVPIEIDGARPAEPQLLQDGRMISQTDVAAGVYSELEWDTIETADFSILINP